VQEIALFTKKLLYSNDDFGFSINNFHFINRMQCRGAFLVVLCVFSYLILLDFVLQTDDEKHTV
jgi:hypothetical protein